MNGKIYSLVISIVAVLLLVALIIVIFVGRPFNSGERAESQEVSTQEVSTQEVNAQEVQALEGWDNTLEKMNYNADVVFLGDSLTKRSDFREYFTDLKIVNVGKDGDTIEKMTARASMVSAVNPAVICVQGGINELDDSNTEETLEKFGILIDKLKEDSPESLICVESLLPISKEVQEKSNLTAETIEEYNEKLKTLAIEKGCDFVDIYTPYELDGELNPEYTDDGIHLKDNEAYDLWAQAVKTYVYEGIERYISENQGDFAEQLDGSTLQYYKNNAVIAWENSLRQMNYDADVVFFGDSIIKVGNFGQFFPDVDVVNLGLGGDTLEAMIARVSMLSALNPEKVFVMGGINSLRDDNIDETADTYENMLNRIQEEVPDAQIYVISVLPVDDGWQKGLPCHRETIIEFNSRIESMANERNMTYIDLFSLYELDGEINPAYSSDGVHPDADSGFAPMIEAIKPYIYD